MKSNGYCRREATCNQCDGGVSQRTDPNVSPMRGIFFVKTTLSYNAKDQFKAGEAANPRTKSRNKMGKRKRGAIFIRRKKEKAMGKKRKTLASGAIGEHDSPFVERFRVVEFSISIGNWVFHAHLFLFFLRVIWYSVMKSRS